LSRSLTALAVFAIAGKIGIAIDLLHLHISFAHALTRFVGGLVKALPVQTLGGGPSHLLRHDRRP
jgi:cobalamin biosynthesis protein CbiG